MRKLLVLFVLLTGCASEEQLRNQQQRQQARSEAVLAYLIVLCEKQGVSKSNEPAMRGCVMAHIARARANSRADTANAWGEMGRSLQQRNQQCSTRPDYMGGWTTTCN